MTYYCAFPTSDTIKVTWRFRESSFRSPKTIQREVSCISQKFQAEWDCENLDFLNQIFVADPSHEAHPSHQTSSHLPKGFIQLQALGLLDREVGGRRGFTDWGCLKESSHHAPCSLGTREPPADTSIFPYSSQH